MIDLRGNTRYQRGLSVHFSGFKLVISILVGIELLLDTVGNGDVAHVETDT